MSNPKRQGNDNPKNYSMNAVPPPSSLNTAGRFKPMQFKSALSQAAGVSKHGYSTMDAISQFANSSQYAVGKKKAVTEDE